ncbi:class I SAM-dependent methyltransferase, partial [Streptomyces fagopyri]
MLRDTFDEAAELYDRARPRYPAALVDELAGRAGLGPGVRVLEIGPGTGQLTVPLARLGAPATTPAPDRLSVPAPAPAPDRGPAQIPSPS